MSGERAVCHAGNALRPPALLSRIFNIPLARPRPSSALCRSSTPARFRHGGSDRGARDVDTGSLFVTLEAHRRKNRASVIRHIGAKSVDDSTVWFRPELPVDRFDPISETPSQPNGIDKDSKRERNPVKKQRRRSTWQWSTQAAQSRSVPVHKIGAKDREIPPADYAGQVVEPLYNRDDVKDEDLPWFQSSRVSDSTPLERLRAEIEAFDTYLRPTAEEQAGRNAVRAQTLQVWSRFCSAQKYELDLDIFGSEKSGLAIATSDLDLRVYKPKYDEGREAEKAPRFFQRRQFSTALADALAFYQRDPNFMLVFMRYSRYPLLSMQHVGTTLDVQIVSGNDTSKAISVMLKYMEDMPALRAIYTLLKYTFEIRGLSDVFRGGIGSYSLFYMVVAAMKLSTETAKDDVAAQLLAVLDFYSDFDTTKSWISIDPLEVLPKIESKPVQSKGEKQELKAHQMIGLQNKQQPYLLCIRDPADSSNDVGRKTFGWKHLQTTMKKLSEDLRQKLEKDDGSLFLPVLVGRGIDMFEARRQKIVAFGRQYPHSAQDEDVPVDTQESPETETVPAQTTEVSSEPLELAESEASKH